MKNKRWSVLIPALALALCLALAGCGLEPFREEIKGSGVLRETRLPLAASANGYTLRIDGISTRELRGGFAPKLVIDESLERAAVLETDNNILHRLELGFDPATGEIRLSAPRNTVFSLTKLTLTVGAPVRELRTDGLWDISYDCPSVKACKLAADGTLNGGFALGALDSLDMNFGGFSDISLNCQGVRACKLAADGTLNGEFELGAVDSLSMDFSGYSDIDLNCQSVRDCRVRADGTLNGGLDFGEAERLDMKFGGFSDIRLNCQSVLDCKVRADGTLNGDFSLGEADRLDLSLSGMSTLSVRGAAKRAVFELEGGEISAFDLTAQEAAVTIRGIGGCEITAEASLDAVIDGGGSITYAGSPKITQRIEGLGSVRAR